MSIHYHDVKWNLLEKSKWQRTFQNISCTYHPPLEDFWFSWMVVFMQGTTRVELSVLERQAPVEMHRSYGN